MDRRIVRVRSLKGGHFRAARHFGAEPVEIGVRTLTRKELEALQADPDLCVQIIHDGEDAETDNPAA